MDRNLKIVRKSSAASNTLKATKIKPITKTLKLDRLFTENNTGIVSREIVIREN